jgi:hypothetical protein
VNYSVRAIARSMMFSASACERACLPSSPTMLNWNAAHSSAPSPASNQSFISLTSNPVAFADAQRVQYGPRSNSQSDHLCGSGDRIRSSARESTSFAVGNSTVIGMDRIVARRNSQWTP